MDETMEDNNQNTQRIYVQMPKQNIFQKIKNWWKYTLTEDDRDIFKIAGIYALDGAMIGAAVTAAVKNVKTQKLVNNALAVGYIQGQMDTYKELAQNPYGMMNSGMKILEQQGKATKF